MACPTLVHIPARRTLRQHIEAPYISLLGETAHLSENLDDVEVGRDGQLGGFCGLADRTNQDRVSSHIQTLKLTSKM